MSIASYDDDLLEYTIADAIDRLLGDVAPREQESVRDIAERLGYTISEYPPEGNVPDKTIVVPKSYSADHANYRIAQALVKPRIGYARKECANDFSICELPQELCAFMGTAPDGMLSEIFVGAVLMPKSRFQELPSFIKHDASMISAEFEMPVKTAIMRAKILGFAPA